MNRRTFLRYGLAGAGGPGAGGVVLRIYLGDMSMTEDTTRKLPPLGIDPLPQINLAHLFVLSDDTGILQHATMSTPDLHHGYCTDDNARALIAAVKLHALPEPLWNSGLADTPARLAIATQRYMAFLAYAWNPEAGRFRNFMQYDRTWLEEAGSEDSHARTLWALGKAVRLPPNDGIFELAKRVLYAALPAVREFHYLRPWAYSLLGVAEAMHSNVVRPEMHGIFEEMADHLYSAWTRHADADWPWWEDELTWGNAKLPHAMLIGGAVLRRPEMVDAALKALRWLVDVQTADDGHLSIIGNRAWMRRGHPPARYDQQPIEAKGMVQVCLAAAAVTGEPAWAAHAVRGFRWFTGANDAGTPLYDPDTGGGYDGLSPDGVNLNQGAESTLAYLLSALELHHYHRAAEGDAHLRAVPALL